MSVQCIPLKPHFYIVKLGYAGVYLFFLFLLQNIDCGYSLEPPRRGGSNVYPQSMFGTKIRKISPENFQILKLKKSLYIAWASFRNGHSTCHRRKYVYCCFAVVMYTRNHFTARCRSSPAQLLTCYRPYLFTVFLNRI